MVHFWQGILTFRCPMTLSYTFKLPKQISHHRRGSTLKKAPVGIISCKCLSLQGQTGGLLNPIMPFILSLLHTPSHHEFSLHLYFILYIFAAIALIFPTNNYLISKQLSKLYI